MISKCLSVLLLVSAISCGKHGLRSGLQIQQRTESVIGSQIPIGSTGHVSQLPAIQPIERSVGIPSTIGSSLSVTDFQVPQTIPQYLLSLPRTVNFEIPQSIPVQLLRLSAPGTVVESFVVQPLPSLSRSPFVSPAQKVRSHPTQVITSVPIETPVVRQTPELSQSSVIPQSASIPRFESNAYSGSQSLGADTPSTGFSTPVKPLNFTPNLPEVNGKPSQIIEPHITQTVESGRTEQIAEPLQQRIESPEISQPISDSREALPQQNPIQQRIESLAQPLTQQRIESLPQPLTQQRIESLPQPLTQQRIPAQSPSMGLSSYSF